MTSRAIFRTAVLAFALGGSALPAHASPVEGPSTEGPNEIVIEGTWYVVARDGVLTDPIWAPA